MVIFRRTNLPELPEVETIRQELNKIVLNKKILKTSVSDNNLRYPIDKHNFKGLEGKYCIGSGREGKNLYLMFAKDNKHYTQELLSDNLFYMDKNDSFFCDVELFEIHLGMSGRFHYYAAGEFTQRQKHEHCIFYFEGGTVVAYNDPRRFGWFSYFDNIKTLTHSTSYKRLGADITIMDYDASYFYEKAKKIKKDIKALLLDQSFIAGLGNIYVCEVLHDCKISPKRLAKDISMNDWQRLLASSKNILDIALKAGGSTISDHRLPTGSSGYFQHQFKVYQKQGTKCPTCLDADITLIKQGGRSSFYCPKCQSK